jgi:hypothetical protein
LRPERLHHIDKGMMAWIENTARKNRWRCAAWMGLDDLIQEGYFCYAKVQARYPASLSRAQRMALVKTAYTNRLHDLSKAKTRQLDDPVPLQDGQTVADALETLLPGEPEAQTFGVMLSSLPREIQEMLSILVTAAPDMVFAKGRPEGINRYLWRLIGQEPCGIDLYSAFCNHFGLVP